MKLHLVSALLLTIASPVLADPVASPVAERFAQPTADETPSFRRHVIPLMGRMGCNSRACHGSFQGQGGFRLSLFGYDFATDHEALTGGDAPRVNRQEPLDSLVLQKPTSADEHGGGERYTRDSWQFNLLRRWIETGGESYQEGEADFVRLEVTPAEILFAQSGQTAALRAVVHWSDGAAEDVTGLCRFQTNDESVATIDETGLVRSAGAGDTHVVVFYDNGVVPVPVIRPVSDRVGDSYPDVPAPTEIDRLVLEKLRKVGIVPADRADDAEFLRRVSLDLAGTLPTPADVERFLADSSPDKRVRKIDELLETPAYAAWWATKFCDLTGNNPRQQTERGFGNAMSRQWYDWVFERIARNAPYDELVAGIALAVSREEPEQPYVEFCRVMGAYFRTKDAADFAERATMPYYWTRRNMRKPEERALSFSYAFLGVRLECAQCHKHPFDQWTQQDFQQFQAFFEPLQYGVAPGDNKAFREMTEKLGVEKGNQRELERKVRALIDRGKPAPFREVFVSPPKLAGKEGKGRARQQQNRVKGRVITPKLLGGEEVMLAEHPDPRAALMEWMRDRENPYFAHALVNRVWANYFGRGIVEPPDDMNLANPPSNAALLDYLAAGFIESGFDLKWLHREITTSDTYQRSWRTNQTNALDRRNFSHALPRRLPAEVLHDAVAQATTADDRIERFWSDPSGRAIGPEPPSQARYSLELFGKPNRDTVCDCARSNDPTLVQTVFLRNDPTLLQQIERGGWVRQFDEAAGRRAAKKGKRSEPAPVDAEALVRQVFLRTVSRPPTEDELHRAAVVIRQAERPSQGLRDMLWTMLNTKEFVVNH